MVAHVSHFNESWFLTLFRSVDSLSCLGTNTRCRRDLAVRTRLLRKPESNKERSHRPPLPCQVLSRVAFGLLAFDSSALSRSPPVIRLIGIDSTNKSDRATVPLSANIHGMLSPKLMDLLIPVSPMNLTTNFTPIYITPLLESAVDAIRPDLEKKKQAWSLCS